MKKKTSRALLWASTVLSLALPEIAMAQDASDEILVTARRREESQQEVPVAVSVLNAAQLEAQGVTDVNSLTGKVPNLVIVAGSGSGASTPVFAIRGLSQQDLTHLSDPSVSLYVNDIVVPRPIGGNLAFFDLASVQVLRGPQGTLYGRNTIGGAVKYITRRLSANTEFNVKVALGEYSQADLIARMNLPVSDTLRLGATIGTFNHDGYGTNVANGNENYNKEVLAGRFSAEFAPSSDLFVRFAADRTQDDSLPRKGHRLTPGPAPQSEPVLEGHYDTRANLYSVLGNPQEVTTSGESLLIEWQINPELTFKSVTAHRKGESTAPIDFDSLNRPLFEAPALYHDDQRSQEFQFTYTGDKWQGVAGVYFMDANAFNEFDVYYNAVVPQGLSLYTLDDMDTKTWAVFADLNYKVSSTLDVTFGGRYTEDEREARIYKRNYLGMQGSPTLGNPAAVGLPVLTDMQKSDLNRKDTKFTPKLGVGWKFAPEHNLYATYAEGFKGGFFDPRMDLGGNPNSLTSLEKRKGVEPEEVSSIELGLKSTFEKGRIQTNVAAFYMDYENVQIPGSIPTYDAAGNINGFAGNVTNAGKAKVKGLEFEALARVTDQFTVQGMLGFIDAEYKEWIVANGLTGSAAALVNVAHGAEFQNTPKTQASITGTYEWPLAVLDKPGRLALQATASYKSKTYLSEFVRPVGVPAIDFVVPQNLMLAQDSYTLLDASLIWTSRDRKLQLGLVGRNLTDKRYKVAGYTFGAFFNTIDAFYGDPRTVKFVASVTF